MGDVELDPAEKAYVDELIADFKTRKNERPEPDPDNFGSVLRCARVAASCSLRELGEALGVSVMFLSDVERGKRPPLSPERIAIAAKYMGTSHEPMLAAAAKVSPASALIVLRDELDLLRAAVRAADAYFDAGCRNDESRRDARRAYDAARARCGDVTKDGGE